MHHKLKTANYNEFNFLPKYGRIGIVEYRQPLLNFETHTCSPLERSIGNYVTNVSSNTEPLYSKISQFETDLHPQVCWQLPAVHFSRESYCIFLFLACNCFSAMAKSTDAAARLLTFLTSKFVGNFQLFIFQGKATAFSCFLHAIAFPLWLRALMPLLVC